MQCGEEGSELPGSDRGLGMETPQREACCWVQGAADPTGVWGGGEKAQRSRRGGGPGCLLSAVRSTSEGLISEDDKTHALVLDHHSCLHFPICQMATSSGTCCHYIPVPGPELMAHLSG